MPRSYYRVIDGVRYKRRLLEAAGQKIEEHEDRLISEQDLKDLVDFSKDGPGITETEFRTLEYIHRNYRFTPEASAWLGEHLADIDAEVLRKDEPEIDEDMEEEEEEPVLELDKGSEDPDEIPDEAAEEQPDGPEGVMDDETPSEEMPAEPFMNSEETGAGDDEPEEIEADPEQNSSPNQENPRSSDNIEDDSEEDSGVLLVSSSETSDDGSAPSGA